MDPAQPDPRQPIGAAESTGAVDFDEVIDNVIDDLPEAFAAQLGSVAIVVEEEANPDQLASVRAFGLFGLYQGVPRTRFGADNVPLPSKITLFRGPLTRANPGPDRLRRAVEDTLLHEIAHHFGIDDRRLHELLEAGRANRISSADRGPGSGDHDRRRDDGHDDGHPIDRSANGI